MMISRLALHIKSREKEIRGLLSLDEKGLNLFTKSLELLVKGERKISDCKEDELVDLAIWTMQKGFALGRGLNQAHILVGYEDDGRAVPKFFLGINGYKILARRENIDFEVKTLWEKDIVEYEWHRARLFEEVSYFKTISKENYSYNDDNLVGVAISISSDNWLTYKHEIITRDEILAIRNYAFSYQKKGEKSFDIWKAWFRQMIEIVALRVALKKHLVSDDCVEILKKEDAEGIYQGKDFVEVKKERVEPIKIKSAPKERNWVSQSPKVEVIMDKTEEEISIAIETSSEDNGGAL